MKRILSFCLFMVLPFAVAADTKLSPKDFAYGLSLVAGGSSSLHEIVLPTEVYKGATRGDLGDLRVFNKAGEVVPHALERLEGGPTAEDRWEPVSLFPLYEGTQQTAEKLSLLIRHEGASVDLSTQGRPGPRKIVGYLMEAPGPETPVKALILNFSEGKNFIRKVDLEASDDLRSWRTLEDGAVVAHMNQEGRILARNHLEFAPTKAAYFRLTLREGGEDPEIASASIQIDPGITEPERRWVEVAGMVREGEVIFDAGGFFPADRIEVLLAEPSVMIDSEISSAVTPDGPRTTVYTGPVFRLAQGKDEATLGPIAVSGDRRSPKRYWFLKPRNKEAALGSKAPTLRLGWVPERLIFVAQGEGPYLLAYGNALAGPSEFGIDALLRRTDASLKPAEAKSGGEIILGGPSKLIPPPPSPMETWKKILTFSLMGLATLGLGLMAYRLVRQMG